MFSGDWATNIYFKASMISAGVFVILWVMIYTISAKRSWKESLKNWKFEIIYVTSAEKTKGMLTSKGRTLIQENQTGTSTPRVILGVPDEVQLQQGDIILCYKPDGAVYSSQGAEPFRCWYAQHLDKESAKTWIKDAKMKFGKGVDK